MEEVVSSAAAGEEIYLSYAFERDTLKALCKNMAENPRGTFTAI